MNSKQHHIGQILAACIKRNLTPARTGFADFIYRLCASYFFSDRRTSRAYIDTLISAWQFDKWKTLVQQNGFLNEEEKKKWMTSNL